MPWTSREVGCARMGPYLARRSTANFSAARCAHMALFYFWNVIGFILIVNVLAKTLTKGETYDSKQIYQIASEFKRIIGNRL